MSAILSKFSISLLIRQFFCGVVFFLPFLLMHGEKVSNILPKSLGESTTLCLCMALACIVGTIIHHLEKNTYSYFVQMLFCLVERLNTGWDKGCCGCLIIFNVISVAFCFLFSLHNQYLFCCLLGTLVVIIIPWIIGKRTLLEETRRTWIISGFKPTELKEQKEFSAEVRENAYCYSILKRLDAWSDNIHCTQCCCFAWIFGYFFSKSMISNCSAVHFAQYKTDTTNETVFNVISVFNGHPLNQDFWDKSIAIAIFILVLEFLFEWHRHSHIAFITNKFDENNN